MSKHRGFAVLMMIMACIMILFLRLLWLQTLAREHYSFRQLNLLEKSVSQRQQRLLLDSGRGQFLDRFGYPLTGEIYSALLIFPAWQYCSIDEDKTTELRSILNVSADSWNAFMNNLQTPSFWMGDGDGILPSRLSSTMVEAIEALELEGAAIVPYQQRYMAPFPAAQLIGYVSQHPQRVATEFASRLNLGRISVNSQIGASGLERTFEPLLHGLGGTSISLYTDSFNRPVAGLGYRLHAPVNSYYPLSIITTLNSNIQTGIEQLADEVGLTDGAIVVLDASTADVAAMVSRPALNPLHVNPAEQGWNNRALQEAIPGSVFKTVVAAAALEHKVVKLDELFYCKGEWGSYRFSCWKKEGHGELTFRQAYAQSCNIIIGQVMLRLTAEQLEDTARRLGVGLPAGWRGSLLHLSEFHQLDSEDSGRIWFDHSLREDEGARLQTAIGQRDVRMTPLQAANMIVTLLNGGKARSVRTVKEIRYKTGRVLANFPEQNLSAQFGAVSKQTSDSLLELMEDVVAEGTGTALAGTGWRIAGKSGTAQVPGSGAERYNQWFVGYAPVESPKYAIAVVSLRQQESNTKTIQLFKKVTELLAGQEHS